MTNPFFLQQIAANITYWQQVAADLSDETLARIDREKQNLFRAVSYGLKRRETVAESLALIVALFPLVERRGYWQEWLSVLEEALQRCPEQDIYMQAALLSQIGFLHQLLHEYPRSITVLKEAVALAETTGAADTLANATYYLASSYNFVKKYQLSVEYLERARAAFAAAGLLEQPKKKAAIFSLQGRNAQGMGEYDQAIAAYKNAIHYWEEAGEHIYAVRIWNNLGNSYKANGNPEAALACFDAAEEALTATVSEDERIRIATNRGNCYYQMAAWEAAEAALRQAERMLRGRLFGSNRFDMALVHNNLAAVLLELERLDEADEHAVQSIAMWEVLHNRIMMANSTGVRGEIAVAQQDWAAARTHFEAAINGLAAVPEDMWAQERRAELAQKLQELPA